MCGEKLPLVKAPTDVFNVGTNAGKFFYVPVGTRAVDGSAEEVGFEPTDGFPSPVFKTGAFNRSATLP